MIVVITIIIIMTTSVLHKPADMTFGNWVFKGSFCGVTSDNGNIRGLGRYATVLPERKDPHLERDRCLYLSSFLSVFC
jgi:hypothetical protein